MADCSETILESVARLLATPLPSGRRDGPERGVEMAATVVGRVEAEAMRHAADLAKGGVDGMALFDAAAYRAASDAGGGGSDVLWTIWTLARVRAHVSAMLDQDASADLVAVSALLDAAHAALSGHEYDRSGRTGLRDGCRERAGVEAGTAATILADLGPGG